MSEEISVEETLKRLLLEREMLRQTAEVLRRRLEMIETLINDFSLFKTTVERLKELKEGDEILVPVGASSYVRARVVDPGKVIYAVGADTFLEQSVERSVEDVDKRLDELHSMRKSVQGQLATVLSRLEESEKAIRALSEAVSKKHAGKAQGRT